MLGRMVVIAARARIHAGNEHEGTRISDRVFGSRDVDDAVLEWLSQHLENRPLEFRKLITKEDPIVGQTYLTRLRVLSASYQSDLRYGVVWTTERTFGN